MALTLTKLPVWQKLLTHQQQIKKTHLRELFSASENRFEKFSLQTNELFLDFSKNHLTQLTLDLLVELADTRNLATAIEAMFKGELVNNTENRAALHGALRNFEDQPIWLNGEDLTIQIKANLAKLETFSKKILQEEWRGFTNQPITDVVNIGIGGSYLGPALATEALAPYATSKLNLHFISNIDGTYLTSVLKKLNLATTLFIVSSKSFSTPETLVNARIIQQQYKDKGCSLNDLNNHFIAITSDPQQAETFGIAAENIFSISDWVGGRYSLWSATGLPLVLSIGMQHFKELLSGARAMDQHFRTTTFNKNMPVVLGLLSVWYANFFQTHSQAILPYSQLLQRLPAYLQQVVMESNGKSVTREGHAINYTTAPVIFGESGTNGQHSFYQLLHQGTQLIPADFIVPVQSHCSLENHHALLYANAISQSKAFMEGKTIKEVEQEMRAKGCRPEEIQRLANHKILPGNRPSNTILINKITPHALGELLALYEHKIFVESVIWDINPFDQWGVERGKQLVESILPNLLDPTTTTLHDSSTAGLVKKYHQGRG